MRQHHAILLFSAASGILMMRRCADTSVLLLKMPRSWLLSNTMPRALLRDAAARRNVTPVLPARYLIRRLKMGHCYAVATSMVRAAAYHCCRAAFVYRMPCLRHAVTAAKDTPRDEWRLSTSLYYHIHTSPSRVETPETRSRRWHAPRRALMVTRHDTSYIKMTAAASGRNSSGLR